VSPEKLSKAVGGRPVSACESDVFLLDGAGEVNSFRFPVFGFQTERFSAKLETGNWKPPPWIA
jgi:hypothetical protein